MAPLSSIMLFWMAPALAAEDFESTSFYLGDPHAHTGLSGDGGSADLGNCDATCGNYADIIDLARGNGLDWVAFTDHVNAANSVTEAGYADLLARVDAAYQAGSLVTLPGGELSVTLSSAVSFGHKTLLFFGTSAEVDSLGLHDVQLDGATSTNRIASCAALWDYMTALEQRFGPVLLIPHHPALGRPMATNWNCHSDQWEPAVEVYSEHGNSLTATTDYDVAWSGPVASGTVESAMDPDGHGLTLGFLAGTDGHDTDPGDVCALDGEHPDHPYGGGLSVVMVDSGSPFDRAALYEAILARHTYATTGPLVPLIVEYSYGGVALGGMGDALELPEGKALDVAVRLDEVDAVAVKRVELWGPWGLTGELESVESGAWSKTIPDGEVPEYVYVAVELDGDWYEAPGTCVDGGTETNEWLWASPSPIATVVLEPAMEVDADGDGELVSEGDCDDTRLRVNTSQPERWYDGLDANCDGWSDYDQDLDGYDAIAFGGRDCDDRNAARYPGAGCAP